MKKLEKLDKSTLPDLITVMIPARSFSAFSGSIIESLNAICNFKLEWRKSFAHDALLSYFSFSCESARLEKKSYLLA